MPETLEAALPELAAAETAVADGADSGAIDQSADGQFSADSGAKAEEVSQQAESPAENSGETPSTDTEAAQWEQDGRTIPPALRKHLAELRTANPELAKNLRTLYFSDRAFRQHFPGGPQEVLKLKEFVDTVGGEEGWQQVQNDVASYKEWARQYIDGDPAFVDDLVEDSPESFAKLMPHMFETWANVANEDYSHHVGRALYNSLQMSPLPDVYRALAADEKFKPLADKLAEYWNGIRGIAETVPVKKVDPERQKFEQEKQQWEEQRQSEFREKVGQELQSFYVSGLESNLGNEFKARNRNFSQLKTADSETYWAMMNDAYGRIRQALQGDKTFTSKFESLLKEGNGQAAVKLTRSRVERLMPEIAKKTYKVFNLGTTTQQKKEQQQTNQQRANVPPQTKLARQPQPEEIDWNRTNSGMILDGKVFLKGRKELVTF